ncbi:MAG: hypothetical protein ACLGIF_01205 [Actinomycetes bacterium]
MSDRDNRESLGSQTGGQADQTAAEQAVRAAVADLEGLADTPVVGHHDRLARAHEILQRTLQEGGSVPSENAETRH